MAAVTLNTAELFGLLLGSALLSSGITLLALHFLYRYRLGPELDRKLDERLRTGVRLIQEGIRERLRERARDLARTGIGLLSGRRPTRDDYDDEGDF